MRLFICLVPLHLEDRIKTYPKQFTDYFRLKSPELSRLRNQSCTFETFAQGRNEFTIYTKELLAEFFLTYILTFFNSILKRVSKLSWNEAAIPEW